MKHDVILLTHAALVGLTPLIPVPLLDDVVKGRIERRMAGELVRAHALDLDKDTVAMLVAEPGSSVLGAVAKGVLTFPLKLVFRKVFFVLEVKRAADEASRTYHRGLLLDLALAAGAIAPVGPRSADEVRIAVQATCAEVGVSPLTVPIRAVFEASKDALEKAGRKMLDGLLSRGKNQVGDDEVKEVVEGVVGDQTFLQDLVAQLKTALDAVPREHFETLRARFEARLGVSLAPKAEPSTGGAPEPKASEPKAPEPKASEPKASEPKA